MRWQALLMLVMGTPLCWTQVKSLRVIPASHGAVDISVVGVYFQELRWGHEGPSYFSTKRAPQRGAQEIAEVSLSGQEAIAWVRFELIDESGQSLSTATASRNGTGADDGGYTLLVDVPARAFRFRVTGRDVHGKPFARVYKRLFRSGDAGPAPIELPEGLPEEQAALFRKMLDATRLELFSQFESTRKSSPDGAIRIARSAVMESSYEPLVSPRGLPIGLRLHFLVRFGAGGLYAVRPHVFPQYANHDLRGSVTMKVLDVHVDPAPGNGAADSLQDVLRFGGDAQYQANVDYRFTFDLLPSYIIRNDAGTRYCVYTEEFRASGRLLFWNAIQSDSAAVKYSVNISSLGFVGETETFIPQRTYLESFLSEGAVDCGPNPNQRF